MSDHFATIFQMASVDLSFLRQCLFSKYRGGMFSFQHPFLYNFLPEVLKRQCQTSLAAAEACLKEAECLAHQPYTNRDAKGIK